MGCTDGHIDGCSGEDIELATLERDTTGSADDEPVFLPPRVALIAESLARQHRDPFDLVIDSLIENRVVAPGSLTLLRCHRVGHQVTLSIAWMRRAVSCHRDTARQSTPIALTG